MGCYRDHVLPRLVDRVCGDDRLRALRARTTAGLHGRVVEIGFGSGHNVVHYPSAVTSVAAVEPSDVAWARSAARRAASPVPVERVTLDAQSLPLPDRSCDTALSTWTLCTVPDPALALAELRRVLRPGGTLHFLEHGLAPDEGVRRWQRRLEPIQKRVAGGCHLTRAIPRLLTDAGFELVELDEFYQDHAPKFLAAEHLGIARTP